MFSLTLRGLQKSQLTIADLSVWDSVQSHQVSLTEERLKTDILTLKPKTDDVFSQLRQKFLFIVALQSSICMCTYMGLQALVLIWCVLLGSWQQPVFTFFFFLWSYFIFCCSSGFSAFHQVQGSDQRERMSAFVYFLTEHQNHKLDEIPSKSWKCQEKIKCHGNTKTAK